MIRAAARRTLLPLLLLAGAVLAVAAIALLAGEPLERSVALGLYAIGSFLAIVGFALGSRNLFRSSERVRSDEEGPSRFWETTEASAILIVIGLIMLLVGTAVDPHARLV